VPSPGVPFCFLMRIAGPKERERAALQLTPELLL